MVGVAPSGIPVPVEGLVPGEESISCSLPPGTHPSQTNSPRVASPWESTGLGRWAAAVLSLSLTLPSDFTFDFSTPAVSPGWRPGDVSQVFLCVWKRSAPERTDGNTSDLQPFPQAYLCFQWSFPFPSLLKATFWGDFWDVNTSRMELKPTLPGWTKDPERTLTIGLLLSVQTCLVFFFPSFYSTLCVSLVSSVLHGVRVNWFTVKYMFTITEQSASGPRIYETNTMWGRMWFHVPARIVRLIK